MSLNIDFPDFNHPEVQIFYEHDLSISKEKVAQILQLPRKTLIKDMEAIVMDCIQRNEFFQSLDDSEQWWSFHFHALWVLIELQATEALPTILNLLKQDDDFCNYWWGDYVTEDLWEIYYHLANDKLKEIKEILLAPGEWVLRVIPDAVAEQIFLHQPERQQEILDWYDSVLDAFIEMEDENEALDGDPISSIVSSLVHLEAKSLLPKIKILYERELVYDIMSGNMESIESHITNPNNRSYKRALKKSIYDRYQDAMNWHGYLMKYDKEYRERNTRSSLSSRSIPKSLPKPKDIKIGRNDPCPCGSGKKYKKCCLKK